MKTVIKAVCWQFFKSNKRLQLEIPHLYGKREQNSPSSNASVCLQVENFHSATNGGGSSSGGGGWPSSNQAGQAAAVAANTPGWHAGAGVNSGSTGNFISSQQPLNHHHTAGTSAAAAAATAVALASRCPLLDRPAVNPYMWGAGGGVGGMSNNNVAPWPTSSSTHPSQPSMPWSGGQSMEDSTRLMSPLHSLLPENLLGSEMI